MSAAGENSIYDITFLRHGESIGNAEVRFQGRSDFPLTETGRAQARALAERWQSEGVDFDLIVSSPLARARETAEILGAALRVAVETDDLWLERDNGNMAGLTHDEAHQRHPPPEFMTPFDSFGRSGEGDWELFLRAGQALHSLLRRAPGRYLVVSQGGQLNQVMYAIVGITPQANFQGPRFRFQNTGFARLTYVPTAHRWLIDGFNDRAHWKLPDSE